MAPSGRKKKKPTVNRPIATTSVPSKAQTPRNDEPPEVVPSDTLASDDIKTEITSSGTSQTVNSNLHEFTPDQLEEHLRDSELQALVETYAPRLRKEAPRTLTRLQTECRLLRSSATRTSLRRFFPQDLQNRALDLVRTEVLESARSGDQRQNRKALKNSDILFKLWILEKTLHGLGFSAAAVEAGIQHIVVHPPASNSGTQDWGLEESLEWLALELDSDDLPRYDDVTGKLPVDTQNNSPRVLSDNESNPSLTSQTNSYHRTDDGSQSGRSQPDSPLQESDFEVSDIGSDIEPEELLATYLTAKTRLFERRPDLIQAPTKKFKKLSSSKAVKDTNLPSGIVKLQEKLRKLESDVLFDQYEADQRWISRRDALALETAQKRRLQLERPQKHPSPLHEQVPAVQEENSDSSDDDDMIPVGDLFNATTIADSVVQTNGIPDSAEVTIRDFGRWQGMSPRRILHEACKARDPKAHLTYKTVSSAAFSNRQALTVVWSKPQDGVNPLNLGAVECQSTSHAASYTMLTISTPDTGQSEAYISTVALFQIFATSTKEEKVFLRLPGKWRDLWAEFAEQLQTQIEKTDRNELKSLAKLVEMQLDKEDDDEVVLTKNFQNRSNGLLAKASDQTSHNIQEPEKKSASEQLQELWTRKSSSPAFKRMLPLRQSLPMFHFRNEALSTIQNNQITIISGETGCGKSTQLPAYILENELMNGRACKIYCTEPRRISAITLAQRVAEELGENKRDVGTSRSLVGYAIRLESLVVESTSLVFATTGIVLRMLESVDGLTGLTHIVIDEVHERSIETDFLLIILKSLLTTRPDLKVILMSATLDSERFSQYFGGAPILKVPGRTFPVETRYLEAAIALTDHKVDEEALKDYDADDPDMLQDEVNGTDSDESKGAAQVQEALAQMDEYRVDYDLIVKLILRIAHDPEYAEYARAVLVFLPGLAEIKRLHDMLASTELAKMYIMHSLHSTVSSEDQQAAFNLPPPGMGKICISTNLCETGITIPDITCVIDTGKHKEMRFDERRQMSRLMETFISRANAKQRRGRAGRVQKGLCFHLFTKTRHDRLMAEQQTPEMLRLSLQDLVMRVKVCKLGAVEATLAEALDPPSSKNIRRAIDTLVEVDALTSTEELTPLGQLLARLPLDPYLGKLVLYGAIFGCLDYSLTAAAILTSKSPFISPIGSRKAADLARLSFEKGGSDLLTEYNAYCAWRRVCMAQGPEFSFCRKSFLSMQSLSNIEDLKAQLFGALTDIGLVPSSSAAAASKRHHHHSSRRIFTEIPLHSNRHDANTDLLATVTAWSFYPKVLTKESPHSLASAHSHSNAHKTHNTGWRNISSHQQVQLHPISIMRLTFTPPPNTTHISYYTILQSGTNRTSNASCITPVHPTLLALIAGEATWHPIAHVLSLDGARLRVRVEGWKAFVAFRALRKGVEEVLVAKWKHPAKGNVEGRLGRWWGLWEDTVAGWAASQVRAV